MHRTLTVPQSKKHGIDKYQCQKCNKSFKKKNSLNVHIYRVHKPGAYQCEVCKKVLKEKFTLMKHYNIHLNSPQDRTKKPLQCLSRKQFLRRLRKEAEEINKRINNHTGEGRQLLWKELIKQNPDIINNKTEALTENEVIDLIKDANLSDRKMLIILQKIRQKWGRKSITPNIRTHLSRRKQIMNKFFSCRLLTAFGQHKTSSYFKSKNGTPLKRYVVFCHDVVGLIAWKALLEGEDNNEYMNIVGVDDGKSLLKICWNWSKKEKDEGKYRLMGPKNSLILACVSDVPETSHNIRILFNLVGIHEMNFILSEDLKLHNITLGKQSHTSKHPCSYCSGYFDLKLRRWIKGDPITLKSLSNDRRRWLEETDGDRSRLQEYNNVEHEALVSFDNDTKILLKIPPPPLHVCLLGPVNHIIQQMEKVFPAIKDRISKLRVVRERYQGKTYEGENLYIVIIYTLYVQYITITSY